MFRNSNDPVIPVSITLSLQKFVRVKWSLLWKLSINFFCGIGKKNTRSADWNSQILVTHSEKEKRHLKSRHNNNTCNVSERNWTPI